MKHRVGLIGAGGIAEAHLAAYQVGLRDKIDVAAAADVDPVALKGKSEKWGIPKTYDSVEELLADTEVEIVDICTPTHLHAEHCIMAAEAKKHILCEKAVATSAAEAIAIKEAVERNAIKFSAAMCLRYSPAGLAVKRILNEGSLGEPLFLHLDMFGWYYPGHQNWRLQLPRFMLLDMTVHSIDLFCHWLGRFPHRVFALTSRNIKAQPELKGDNAVMLSLDFGSAHVQLNYCWYSYGQSEGRRFRIECSEGSIIGDFSGKAGSIKVYKKLGNFYEPPLMEFPGGMYSGAMVDLVEAIENDREPACHIYDQIKVHHIIDAGYESAAAGKVIELSYQY